MSGSPNEAVLVYLETSGNQAFIFGTNRLKENVGASEMTYRVGTERVAEAVNEVFFDGRPEMPFAAATPEQLNEWLLAQPVLEAAGNDRGVEVIVATSGKAVLLVRDGRKARELVSSWSLRVICEAPGVDALAVVSEPFDLASPAVKPSAAAGALRQAIHRFDAARALRPAPEARFPRLPPVAACESSGLPAERALRRQGGGEAELLSEVSFRKRQAAGQARDRLSHLLAGARLPKSVDEILAPWEGLEGADERDSWIGVVHADGNGLGQLFIDLDDHARVLAPGAASPGRGYLDLYRRFSIQLDRATRDAFGLAALPLLPTGDRVGRLPILPLVVGGDDLTVICEGRSAIAFTEAFIAHFEAILERGSQPDLTRVARHVFGVPRLGMAAGVALVKAHFPFFTAYDLAEELVRSAKAVKRHVQAGGKELPASALDFHVNFDSSVVDLTGVRSRLDSRDRRHRLTAKPFVVTPIEKLGADASAWVRAHHLGRWQAARQALAAQDERRRRIFPAAQAHAVRLALHQRPERAAELFERLQARYSARRRPGSAGFDWHGALWLDDPDAVGRKITVFQDALEALDLYRPPEAPPDAAPRRAREAAP